MEEYKLTVKDIIEITLNHNKDRYNKGHLDETGVELSIEYYLKENYSHKKI